MPAPLVAPPTVTTNRLTLVGATRELALAAFAGPVALSRALLATVPSSWPPPLVDDTLLFTSETLDEHPDQAGWWAWYFIRSTDRLLVGCGGLKGMPSLEGTVEIGYSLFEEYQCRGYATEAAGGLIRWAFTHPAVTRVLAETYPELVASIRVMEKNGLTFTGAGSADRVIRFELTREAHRHRTRDAGPRP
jgi:ribosomal-protein-alanine N-acetyltransferase